MKKIIQIEAYRLFHSWGFYMALIIGIMLSVWCLHMNCLTNAWQLEMMDTTTVVYYYPLSVFNSYIGVDYHQLASSVFYTILPILVVMPFGASLARDIKSGYIKNVLTRCRKEEYYGAKIFITFLGGVLVVAVTMLFSLITTAMFLPALDPIIASNSFPGIDTSTIIGTLYLNHPVIYILGYILFDALIFGIFAAMSATIAIYSSKPFLALCAPFVIFNLLSYVLSYMPRPLMQMTPSVIVRQAGGVVKSFPMMLLMLALMFVVTVVPYWSKVKRNNDVL